MVAFVHNDLTVGLHDVSDAPPSSQALDHRHVEAPIRLAPTTTNLADFSLVDTKEHGELCDPLIQKRTAMYEDQRAPDP